MADSYQGPVKDSQILRPSDMIAYGDVPAVENTALISYNANMDVTDTSAGPLPMSVQSSLLSHGSGVLRWPCRRSQAKRRVSKPKQYPLAEPLEQRQPAAYGDHVERQPSRGLTPSISKLQMIRKKSAALASHEYSVWLYSLLILVAGLVLFGCSKSGPSTDMSLPPLLIPRRQTLSNCGVTASRHGRIIATRLPPPTSSPFRKSPPSLSSQQTDALTKAVDEFGQEAFNAANKGDADATEAVIALRATGRRSAPGK